MCSYCNSYIAVSSREFMKNNFEGKHIPLDGTLELTHKCNFKCVHCYGQNERNEKDLSYDQWIGVLEKLKKAGCLNLIFTGGEALLRKDFCDLYIKSREMGFLVSVFSNASLLDDKLAKVFWEYPITYFSTTMYGFSPSTYAVVTGSERNYQMFMNGLSLLKKYSITTELKAVVLKENLHEIKKIYDYANEQGFLFRCSAGIRSCNDSGSSPFQHTVTPEEAFQLDIEAFPERLRFWQDQALNPSAQPYTTAKRKNCYKYLCHAGESSFMIDASGVLHCCGVDRINGISIIENDFLDCWENFIPKIINQKVGEDFPCLQCKDFRYCEQCSAEIELESGGKMIPNSNVCRLARLRHKWCDDYKMLCRR